MRVAVSLGLRCILPRESHTRQCGVTVDALESHGFSCERSAGRTPRHDYRNDVVWRCLILAGLPIPWMNERHGLLPTPMVKHFSNGHQVSLGNIGCNSLTAWAQILCWSQCRRGCIRQTKRLQVLRPRLNQSRLVYRDAKSLNEDTWIGRLVSYRVPFSQQQKQRHHCRLIETKTYCWNKY